MKEKNQNIYIPAIYSLGLYEALLTICWLHTLLIATINQNFLSIFYPQRKAMDVPLICLNSGDEVV